MTAEAAAWPMTGTGRIIARANREGREEILDVTIDL